MTELFLQAGLLPESKMDFFLISLYISFSLTEILPESTIDYFLISIYISFSLTENHISYKEVLLYLYILYIISAGYLS